MLLDQLKNVSVATHLPWVISCISIYVMWQVGNLKRHARWIIMLVNLYVEVRDEKHRSEMEHKLREAAAFYDATQFDPLLARENPCQTLEEVEAELELK